MLGGLALSIIEKVSKSVYDRFQKEKLSDVEGHILVEASNSDGSVRIVELDHPYNFVRAGHVLLYDAEVEPRIAAEYRDALDSLITKGYLRQDGAKSYQLTTDGYEKANRLKDKGT